MFPSNNFVFALSNAKYYAPTLGTYRDFIRNLERPAAFRRKRQSRRLFTIPEKDVILPGQKLNWFKRFLLWLKSLFSLSRR